MILGVERLVVKVSAGYQMCFGRVGECPRGRRSVKMVNGRIPCVKRPRTRIHSAKVQSIVNRDPVRNLDDFQSSVKEILLV
jgi:hypothetical protein